MLYKFYQQKYIRRISGIISTPTPKKQKPPPKAKAPPQNKQKKQKQISKQINKQTKNTV